MADNLPPQYTLPWLTPIHRLLATISSPIFLPFLSLPLSFLVILHAVRVSYAACQVQGYPSCSSSSRAKNAYVPSVGKSLTLVWTLLFGGWSILALLLAQPSPLLIADVHVSAFVYGVVHIACYKTGIAQLLVEIGQTQMGALSLDILSSFVDSICRTDGITSLGVDSLSSAYLGSLSPLTLLFAPTLIGGGGPLLIGLFDLASPTGQWRLQIPPSWIKDPWQLGGIDIWSSALVGIFYALLSGDANGHPIFSWGQEDMYEERGPMLDKGEAKLFLSAALFILLSGNRLRKYFAIGEGIFQRKADPSSSSSASVLKKDKEELKKVKGTGESSRGSGRLLVAALALPLVLVAMQYLLAGDDFLVNKGWVFKIGEDPMEAFDVAS